MAAGTVFVYLLILALVAPLLWLVWWAIDSLGTGPRHPLPVSVLPQPPRYEHDYAVAADLHLPVRAMSVGIYDLAGRRIDACIGPNASGKCPHPNEEGVVPCSGCILAVPMEIRGSFEWEIPANYRSCLLGSYAIFRQTAPAAG